MAGPGKSSASEVVRQLLALRALPGAGAESAPGEKSGRAVRVLRRLGLLTRGGNDPARLDALMSGLAGEAESTAAAVFEALADYGGDPCAEDPDCASCRFKAACPHANRRLTLKEIPEDQRPRERLVRSGPDALTDAELLAIVLRSGTPRATAVDVAQLLLMRFGGLRGLAERTAAEICTVDGVGPAKAAQVLAALSLARRLAADTLKKGASFRDSRQVFEHFFPLLRAEKQEKFLSVLLDAKNRVLRTAEISSGGLTSSAVHPRDVFRPALAEAASGLIFVHNHPSGDPTPSADDVTITQRLVKAGELMGIRVLDHVIIGEEGYVSLADEGKMR